MQIISTTTYLERTNKHEFEITNKDNKTAKIVITKYIKQNNVEDDYDDYTRYWVEGIEWADDIEDFFQAFFGNVKQSNELLELIETLK